jgi:hypothetical protein
MKVARVIFVPVLQNITLHMNDFVSLPLEKVLAHPNTLLPTAYPPTTPHTEVLLPPESPSPLVRRHPKRVEGYRLRVTGPAGR